VLASLNFPDISAEDAALITRFTRVALATLTELGASPGEPEFVDEPIDIVPGTRLSAILGTDRVIGRSGHHQAVDPVGAGLVAAARALDGIVEGVEDPDRSYLGVQWHPEDDDGPAGDRLRLFGAFVDAAEAVRTLRGVAGVAASE
jgi:putative glutamine amidotransferase